MIARRTIHCEPLVRKNINIMMGRCWRLLTLAASVHGFVIIRPAAVRHRSIEILAKEPLDDEDDEFDVNWATEGDEEEVVEDSAEDLIAIDDIGEEEEEVMLEEDEEEDDDDIAFEDEDDEYDEDFDDEDEVDVEIVNEDEVKSSKKKDSKPKAPKIEWNEEEDGVFYEMEDPADSDDPEYTARQLKLVQEAKLGTEQRRKDSFNVVEYMNSLTEEEKAKMDASEFFRTVEERSKEVLLTADDFKDMDVEEVYKNTKGDFNDIPYPKDPHQPNVLANSTGLSDDVLRAYDEAFRDLKDTLSQEHWDKVTLLGEKISLEDLSNQTIHEISDALDEIGGSAYNCTKWLIYDLNFNVSNLILAAVKHNPDAPIIFQHWYPQLMAYDRYRHARDRDFDFTWDDVDAANTTELEYYYKGFGYDSIPLKAPAETGIMGFEDMDEEETKMAAFAAWVQDVYNPEADRVDFDEDDLRDEDNVFSEFYEEPQHPDLPDFETVEEEMEDWHAETTGVADTPEVREYRDRLARTTTYTVVDDPEFREKFRGHLIVACSAADEDLEVAERITERFEKEFGKAVYVETQVLSLAGPEDDVFEVWLESYEVDLLHSKKRATSNTVDWDGPADVDDKQLDFLTEQVRYLISDEARNSFSFETEYPV